MKNWTLEDLKSLSVDESTELQSTGHTGRFGVNFNYSNIQSRLIQEAGRWCKRYASDILYNLSEIERELDSPNLEKSIHFFGFRENGVDHAEFILSQLNGGSPKEIYRAVWKLEISVTNESRCTMSLHEINL